MEIVRKEAAKKTEVARLKAFEDLEKKEEQIKLWVSLQILSAFLVF